MKKLLITLAIVSCLPASAMAKKHHHHHQDYKAMALEESSPAVMPASPFSIGVYGGYSFIDGADSSDGHVGTARLALDYQFSQYKSVLWGVELGMQSGTTLRLSDSSSVNTALGGLPVQATLKPVIDLLLTAKGRLSQNTPWFGMVKAGLAYREMHLNDRTSSQDSLQKFNPELQLGVGYQLSEHLMLSAYYQGIYSNHDAGVSVDTVNQYTYINHIPTQQAGFLGFEYTV